ncbi:glycosyl hydrolase [Microbacterium sp. DT81.1]|uniref:glycosyl hydrolase n=1 Tax=Microbacterium sp. DT81.1 TaxID=3393413 RepID=UPI003CF6197D
MHRDNGDDLRTELWRTFVEPPDSARPRVWWHWMDGNVDVDGIRRDLRWLHAVGVRGVQLFDGGMGVPLVVPHAVRPGSDAWAEAVSVATRTAEELGLEFAVATSAGWSAAGAPWVEPADAMKKVVWSEQLVDGGGPLAIPLPPLPATAGLYQDCPRWGTDAGALSFSSDWRVLAFAADDDHETLRPDSFAAAGEVEDWSPLCDGSFASSIELPRDPDGWSATWVEQRFAEPTWVGSITVGLPGPRGFGAAPAPTAVLQASQNGIAFHDVIELPATAVPARTAAFPPVRARTFRLVLSAASAADALPPVGDGVRLPPVLRRASEFRVSEFVLRPGGRVHRAEEKAGFGVVADYFAVDTDPGVSGGTLDPAGVVDLTDQVKSGILHWNAPAGRWRVLRLGASLTGQTNGPALTDVTGLEIDKLDGARVAAYLESYLSRTFGAADADRGPIGALLSDSIEAGPQNWTERILEQFRQSRGYDPTPWLPALAGFVVGSAAESDRFLFDYRRTIAELFASAYYGTIASVAHRHGMVHYAEALEDGRPQLGDDLAMRSHADVPMGAMWTFGPQGEPRPTYVADLKGAASVAHVYDKKWTGSEAFTSFERPWSSTPQSLKHVADLQLALGVTRFCIHTSPHQPITAPPPGIALAPFLGQAFTVNETWAGVARPWIDYLSRCAAMLNTGRPAVDIAVFVGEEAPVTGLFEHRTDESVPPGFDFDYIGADALRDILRVENGRLASAGATYRVLYLGGASRRLTVSSLGHIERLLAAGATVVGERPLSSPSLADEPADFDAACERIWSGAAGRMIATDDLAAALAELGEAAEFVVEGGPVRQIARLIDGRRVTFLANPKREPIEVTVRVPASVGPLVGWDPVMLTRNALPAAGTEGDIRSFALSLPAFGSVFVMQGTDADAPIARETGIELRGAWMLHLPGRENVHMEPRPRLWTDLDAEARVFSGTGVYRLPFDLDAVSASADRLLVQFGQVGDIARVLVNGTDCGIAWTAPFQVDVTAAIREGGNVLEVQVTTPWRNRLIGEASAATGEIFAPMADVYEPAAAPLPAGLAGPVTLVAQRIG